MNLDIYLKYILWFVGISYGYGAVVHLVNMAGFAGYDWMAAPLKWQVLDVVYLILNLIVLVGFLRDWRPAYPCFFVAAGSQIMLYTIFRDWILDVPADFARGPEHQANLDGLVLFHVVSVIIVGGIHLWRHRLT